MSGNITPRGRRSSSLDSRHGSPSAIRALSPLPDIPPFGGRRDKDGDELMDLPPAPTWTEVKLMLRNMETMGKTLIAVQEKLATQSSSGKTGKFNEPTMFSGQATAIPGFVQSIKDTLYLQCHIYVTDKDKCIYMSTYFSQGLAKEWYNAVLKLNPSCLDEFDNFLTAFIKNFGDSNLIASAQKKLDNLFQTGPASQYAAKFMDHIVYLDVTEASKIHFFTRHLKPRI
ncbi:hypothetical protein PQX77_002678 [Marasmius sp. AFHP31]|nr:hypothetical protein PQX77_002678 [Marasmius sp. AFHP31]